MSRLIKYVDRVLERNRKEMIFYQFVFVIFIIADMILIGFILFGNRGII